jgi:hypothetical protein
MHPNGTESGPYSLLAGEPPFVAIQVTLYVAGGNENSSPTATNACSVSNLVRKCRNKLRGWLR